MTHAPSSDITSITSSDVTATEEQLVEKAQSAVSQCRWVVGECAAQWTRRYAKGRTDSDFGSLVGLSGDQIFQRRRVWEAFADVYAQFENLKWSHFYAALNWDDAPECLQWADETRSTVAEMKAWRRAIRGEDLTAEPEAIEAPVGYLGGESAFVQDPGEFGSREPSGIRSGVPRPGISADSDSEHARLTGVARGLDEGADYAPFRQGAVKPPPNADSEKSGNPPADSQSTPEQLAKRICHAVERCTKAITPEFQRAFKKLPGELRQRLIEGVNELSLKLGELER